MLHLERIVAWYFDRVYGRWEGPGIVPFYCDPARIGSFAVAPAELAAGRSDTLFKLAITLSMYQARRDRLIMAQQLAMEPSSADLFTSLSVLAQALAETPCDLVRGPADRFEAECDVCLVDGKVTCGRLPAVACPVKEASRLLRRTANLGKLPVSAWMRLWKDSTLERELAEARAQEANPTRRAERLVRLLATIHGVGPKVATMVVSVLSTPALAPGLTPWFPTLSGYELVVVDTNVVKVVDALRGPTALATPAERTRWLRQKAARIDLSAFEPGLPIHSVRLVQQALYWFGSTSNRAARGDSCSTSRDRPCAGCVPQACPFYR